MGVAIRIFTLLLVAPFMSAWSLMIAIGIIHLHAYSAIAPIGFSSCLGITYMSCFAAAVIQGFNLIGGLLTAAEYY